MIIKTLHNKRESVLLRHEKKKPEFALRFHPDFPQFKGAMSPECGITLKINQETYQVLLAHTPSKKKIRTNIAQLQYASVAFLAVLDSIFLLLVPVLFRSILN